MQETSVAIMPEKDTAGHRARLRNRFLKGELSAFSEEAMLELLLTYAIPRKDMKPLAKRLLSEFGGLAQIYQASVETLCKVDGVGENIAALVKLVGHLRLEGKENSTKALSSPRQIPPSDFAFEPSFPEKTVQRESRQAFEPSGTQGPAESPEIRLFGKIVLKEAIQLLPHLPEPLDSLDDARRFFRENLHYSAASTRKRNAAYIVQRMFPCGFPDKAMVLFSKRFGNARTFREVCFYRFMKTEPLACRIIESLFIPNIGSGKIKRIEIKDYLRALFPLSKSIDDCVNELSASLAAAEMAKSSKSEIHFTYREIPIAAFSFILHSEFPAPGMYDMAEAEGNQAFRAMLWKPDRIIPAMYKLRNYGLISKISDIDQIRQFTTRWTLEESVQKLGETNFHDESN